MINIKIVLASKKDKGQLLEFFKHYKVKSVIENRVNCYLSHNFTVVAKNRDKIIGILQWHIKENPELGVAEFEEINVSKQYRNKGIGSQLVEYSIQLIKDYFKRNKIKPRKIFLFVSKENKVGQKLYKKHGFRRVSCVDNLFSDDKKELFYCLNID